MRKFVLAAGFCALLALFVVAVPAAGAFPSNGSGEPYVYVALTANGPSPSTVRMHANFDVLIFVNQDSVAHTVVFADGHCSLNVPPGEPPNNESHCISRQGQWPVYVGSYAYTVDGTFPGTVDVVGLPRSVSLTARTHTIRLGRQLTLHGKLTFGNQRAPFCPALSSGGSVPNAVRVLARHHRGDPFQQIAMFPVRPAHKSTRGGKQGCSYAWQLKVRPGIRLTYIAEANGFDQYWERATSRPFTVRIRH